LIEKVSGISRDQGVTYEVTLSMRFNPATWDPQVTFINPDDGKPPPDLVAGTGYKVVQILPEVTFPTWTFGPN
jgi:hypothetical protein